MTINDNTMEIRMPPITAMASGCSICDPAPKARDSGSMPAMAAMAALVAREVLEDHGLTAWPKRIQSG